MIESSFPSIKTIITKALSTVKSNYRIWLLLLQISLFVSTVGLFMQAVLAGVAGFLSLLLSFAFTAPLYGALYTSALRIHKNNFQSGDLLKGYKKFSAVIGVASLESIFFFVLIFPLNTYIGHLIIESGMPIEELQAKSWMMDEQKLQKLASLIVPLVQKNILNIMLLSLPIWPFYAYVRARLFSSYYFIIEENHSMGLALVKSLSLSKKYSLKITSLVLITDVLFPVFLLFFFVTYPLKYAIYGLVLDSLLQHNGNIDKTSQSEKNTSINNTTSEIKNPYLD